jgi:hypothetical protein
MSEDHLDRETSVSVDMAPTGVTAKARSRFVAAIDRLCGNAIEFLNAPMERRISRDRAMIEGERKIISAVAEYGIERLKHDPQFANRVAEKHFERLFDRQNNKDKVVAQAIEDLRHEAISAADAAHGPQKLDSQFLDRLERYAEDASTEELQQRWGRVLSAEIRKPGSFSPKVLRIVDELDAGTARIFEELCKSILSNVLPRSLVGDLPFDSIVRLTSAGLIVEPGLGQIRPFHSIRGNDDKDHWFLDLGEFALAFLNDGKFNTGEFFPLAEAKHPLVTDEEKAPAIPVFVVTEAGSAVAKILPNNRRLAFSKLAEIIRSRLPDLEVEMLERDSLGKLKPFDAPPQ